MRPGRGKNLAKEGLGDWPPLAQPEVIGRQLGHDSESEFQRFRPIADRSQIG